MKELTTGINPHVLAQLTPKSGLENYVVALLA